jgi:O-antigen ligase/tetratricopeptide (TPR) repeat protein
MQRTQCLNDLRDWLFPFNTTDPASPTEASESVLGRLGRALLFIHLLFSPLIFSTKTFDSFEYPKVMALTVIAILLLFGGIACVVFMLVSNWGKGDLSRRLFFVFNERIALGMLLFFFSALCSTLLSINWQTSFYGEQGSFSGLVTVASYTTLFFGTRFFCRDLNEFRTLFVATILGVFGTIIYGVVQAIGLDPVSWENISTYAGMNRVSSFMGHPNHLGAFLVISFPIICFFRILALKKPAIGIAVSLMLIECLAAILVVLTLSRGAWLAMAFMLLVLTLGFSFVTKSRKIVLSVLTPWMVGLILGTFCLSFVPSEKDDVTLKEGASTQIDQRVPPEATPHVSNPIWSRLQQMNVLNFTKETRWTIWSAAFAMFLDHPFLGIGTDAFRLGFEQYRPLDYWPKEWGATLEKAHNELLQIMATQGGLGLISILIIITGIGVSFVRSTPFHGEWEGLFIVAVFAGVLGFFIHNFFSFTVTGYGTLFVTFLAFFSRLEALRMMRAKNPSFPKEEFVPLSRRLYFLKMGIQGLVWVSAFIVIYLFVYQAYLANRFYSLGYGFLSLRSPEPAIAAHYFNKAVLLDTTRDDYFRQLGIAYHRAADKTTDSVLRKNRLMFSRRAHERAIALVPVDSYNWITFAEVLNRMAQESPPLARKEEIYFAMKRAITLDPNNAEFYVIGASMAISFRDREYALRFASTGAMLYPDYAVPHAQLGSIALLDTTLLLSNGQNVEAKRRSKEAIDHIRKALSLFSKGHEENKKTATAAFADAHLYHAQAEERLGEFSEAYASYARLLEIQPFHPEGTKAFAAFKKRMERKEESTTRH